MPRRSTRTRRSRRRVALHIPWDKVDDYDDLRRHAEDLGVALGTINSNTFQDDDYKFGALTHDDDAHPPEGDRPPLRVHRHHGRDRIARPEDLARRGLELPGPGRHARPPGPPARLAAADLRRASASEQRLVLEYKFFEPAFYHTDVPDWGTSYAQVAALGDRAMVCLDTGHHAPGTNIEFIVMQLLRLGKLGSFDFNSRFYADDDLIVGAADPFQLFRILFEVIRGGGLNNPDVAFMLDQCHNIEDKIPGQIRSVLNVQEMTARALLVDRDALARRAGRGRRARRPTRVLMDAFYTDVRPALAEWRESRGLAGRPDGRVRGIRLPGARSRPTASAAPRPAGARERHGRSVRRGRRALSRVYPAREPNGTGSRLGARRRRSPAATSTCPRRTGSPAHSPTRGIDRRLGRLPARAAAGRWATAMGVEPRGGVHYPAASDDIIAAWTWTRRQRGAPADRPGRLAIGGASAGANLVTGAVLRMLSSERERSLPALVVLAYPTLLAVQPAPDRRAAGRARRATRGRQLRPRCRARHVRELPRRPGRRRAAPADPRLGDAPPTSRASRRRS